MAHSLFENGALDRRSLLVKGIALLGSGYSFSAFGSGRKENGYDISALKAAMYRRSLVLELPFMPAGIPDNLSPYYPQALSISSQDREIYILYSCTFNKRRAGTLVVIYNMDNADLKSWFVSPVKWREALVFRSEKGKRRLYTLGANQPIRYDITRLPEPGSTLTPETDFFHGKPSSYQMTWVGNGFAYTDGSIPKNKNAKTQYIITDSNFNQVRKIRFPVGSTGTYDRNILLNFPKTQGITWQNGLFLFSCGSNYVKNSSTPPGNSNLLGNQQGMLACSESGNFLTAALCNPDKALELTGRMIGREISVHENEGIFAAEDGKSYGLWQVMRPSQRKNGAKKWGIVITEEMSRTENSIDYSVGSTHIKDKSSFSVNTLI